MDIKEATNLIKQEAFRLGFSACGTCKAEFVGIHASYLQEWLSNGFHGEMLYMNKHVDKRSDPRLLVKNAKSIIMVALNYYPEKKQLPHVPQFAYYAYGRDYHLVVKEKLQQLYLYIHNEIFPISGRVFCDTAPILEKYHAMKAGLGWIGKNSQLIIPNKGSYFFLGAIVLDAELDYDSPIENRCGGCSRCLEACPTQALLGEGSLNANRCLAYLTIEHKGELPSFYQTHSENQVYGCDVCNKVCPWNRCAEATSEQCFTPSEEFLSLAPETIENMDENLFDSLFNQSAVGRIGLDQLKRNLASLSSSRELCL